MVIRVFKEASGPRIVQQVASPISDFCFTPITISHEDALPPKYHNADGSGNPYAQIDQSTEIKQVNEDGTKNWCDNGY